MKLLPDYFLIPCSFLDGEPPRLRQRPIPGWSPKKVANRSLASTSSIRRTQPVRLLILTVRYELRANGRHNCGILHRIRTFDSGLGAATTLDFELRQSAELLEEIVVVGYGSQEIQGT